MKKSKKFNEHHTPNVCANGSKQQLHQNPNDFIPTLENLPWTLKSLQKLISAWGALVATTTHIAQQTSTGPCFEDPGSDNTNSTYPTTSLPLQSQS